MTKKYKIISLSIFLLLLTSCSYNGEPKTKNMLSEKNILMVVSPINFRDEEYNEPRRIFDQENIKVKIASIQGGTAAGAGGTEVEIDLTISEVNIEDFDVIVFIGGPGMAEIVDDESMQILAKKFYQTGKVTSAICVAPAILAKAGILKDKKATSWSGVSGVLTEFGAEYTGESVTIDANIITADGPESAKEFGEAIVNKLN